ncbi:MAG: methionine synthase [Deltaproteobacteria bacterium]|nr:methionine synthase [Deltaproteobacteria bacterium]
MNKRSLFDPIIISAPEKEIYRRLGFKKGITQITALQKDEIHKYMDDAQLIIRLKGVAVRMPIVEKSAEYVRLKEDVTFESRQLAAFLSECSEAVLMAATAGESIMEAIRKDTSGGNVTRGVVFDATASEMSDAALDWIMSYLNQSMRREGKALTKSRYSAGYGDFSLTNQRTIYDLLHMEDIGVALTESFILMPEKSVTAIAGIPG